uniref:START domain-containing protein n=2 Tax=Physcomitrium patens TaxID=3218 RepID=A0A2K1IW42_PHYPA|nr:hypothetical protein PHYPA_025439 [Physcomitrium patens]
MAIMEGWLYLIESNKLMMTHPRKRYFVLSGNQARYYKEKPAYRQEAPLKSGSFDPYTRVVDHGRESIHGRTLFVFEIYDSYTHGDKLKFGARSSEEAAKWMEAFKEAAEQDILPGNDGLFVPSGGRRKYPFRLSGRRSGGLVKDLSGGSGTITNPLFREGSTTELPGWVGSLLSRDSSARDASPDVVADSPWQIFGCVNGLRLFRETTDHHGFKSMIRGEDPPALMGVGVVFATCESVFQTVMTLGSSRSEWDFCYAKGRVIEHIDGHSDIVHKQFHTHWLPWRMKPRDLVVHRYWRREDDGSYVILYKSVKHEKCRPRRKFVRAWLKSGGYVISPLPPQGGFQHRCAVKHILTVDWKHFKTPWSSSKDRVITLKVLERVAALREFYKVKPADYMPTSISPDLRRLDVAGCKPPLLQKENIPEVHLCGAEVARSPEDNIAGQSMFRQLAEEEFFDVPEDSAWDTELEPDLDGRRESTDPDETSDEDQNGGVHKLSAAATIVKRFQGMAAQKRTHQDDDEDGIELLAREGTLPKSSGCCTTSCYESAEASIFLIRGKHYLQDRKKVVAKDPVMQFVAADWLKSNKREDHLASRPSNPVQQFLANQRKIEGRVQDPFFFIINIQVPGSTTYSLALYYMITQPLSDFLILENFVRGDDRHRNASFKLIPHIAKGPWIVKQSVGKTACLIGEALEITYHTDKNYIELDVDIGSSSVAKGVVNLVLGYLSNLVIELAFLIQANTEEELPEYLLGTCRLVNLDIAKAIPARPE